MDALAAPFVQGRLTQRPTMALVHSQCAHCGREISFNIDSHLRCQTQPHDARPLLFMPLKLARPGAPSIIDDF